MLDLKNIRQDFPILKEKINGKRLVYLDNAATTQKPKAVIEAVADYYRHDNANIHRGIHTLAERATEGYEKSKSKIARLINAAEEEVVFVRNATEAINLVAFSWGSKNLEAGDTVVLSQMEHHANMIPWQILAVQKSLNLEFVRITEDGQLDLNHLEDLMRQNPGLLSLVHISNVLGTINPLPQISRLADRYGIPLLVDGAQSLGHLEIDVRKLGLDFFAFTGHKMLGPTGIGVLWAKREHLREMPPFLGGGEMMKRVDWDSFTANEPPWKFEAGTPHIAGAIGLGAAVDYLLGIGLSKIRQHEIELVGYTLEKLTKIDRLRVLGPPEAERRGGLVAFVVDGLHPHDLATVLDTEGIAIRSGHHCAMPLHRQLELPATARASMALYNTREEIDRLAAGIRLAQEMLTG